MIVPKVTREAIVAEALSWIGTPFHDCCGVKGEGVDCVHLLKAVAVAAGIVEDFDIDAYKPQWFMHRDEPRFLAGMSRYCRRVEEGLAGDFEMFNFGRHAAHGAILIDSESMVHAYMPAGRVILDWRRSLSSRHDSYWSVF